MRGTPARAIDRCGKNLEKMLQLRDMTVAELASLAKVTPKQVYNLLNGSHDPRLKSIEKVANALGLATWQLLALDMEALPAQHAEVLHLLDLFSRADEAGRKAILQVAEVVAAKAAPSP